MGKSFVCCVVLLAVSLVSPSESQYTIPGTDVSYTPSASDALLCNSSITTYFNYFNSSASAPANCSEISVTNAGWNNFKQGFSASGYNLSTDYNSCNNIVGANQTVQTAMCEFVNTVSNAGVFCDQIFCAADNLNVGLRNGSSSCSKIGQTLCLVSVAGVNKFAENVVASATAAAGGTLGGNAYDPTKVNFACDQSQCRAATTDTTSTSTTKTSGAASSSLAVAIFCLTYALLGNM